MKINSSTQYFKGTGCLVSGQLSVPLSEREMELFDLLLYTPRVTVPRSVLQKEMALSAQSIAYLIGSLRSKIGPAAVFTHRKLGYSLHPEYVLRGVIKVNGSYVEVL